MNKVLVNDLLRMLPWLLMGFAFSLWGALFLWIGYSWGHNRGLRDRPQEQRHALSQARFERDVAQERLDTERMLTKRLEVVVSSLAANRDEEPRLKVVR